MAHRELNLKPSCAHEIHGLSPKETAVLWEKIGLLIDDPIPDGKLKKKLAGHKDLYRLRVGSLRVFYSFGDTWVRLLAIRDRSEAYSKKNEAIAAEAPAALPPSDPSLDDAVGELDSLGGREAPRAFVFEATSPKAKLTRTPLPRKLTAEWLLSIKLPAEDVAHLAGCKTEEELLASGASDGSLQRVVDNLFPKTEAELAQQPDLRVGGVQDLVRFKEGTLLSFLLTLDADQEKLVDWALKGSTLVRGGAGTGKSTVALYRVRALLRGPKAKGDERVVFATYTATLKAASEQLLSSLLTSDERARVRVATCDELARNIVASHRKVGEVLSSPFPLLREARKDFDPGGGSSLEKKLRRAALDKLSDAYLLDEMAWVIEGRGLASLDEYLEAPRPGRSVAFGPKMRQVVWALWLAFSQKVKATGKETFAQLRREALEHVVASPGKHAYDFVLVDEAQDLAPTALRLMAHLAKGPEGLFFAADDKQSIYARGHGYAAVDPRLSFKGRTAVLVKNYRSTEEIDRAAFELLTAEEGQALEPSVSPHHGPQPLLLRGSKPADEPRWAAKFLREMARYLRIRPGAAAVLVFDRKTGEAMAEGMTKAGLEAKFYPSGQVDLGGSAVKVMTVHAAKGLEFPSVVVAGLGGLGSEGEGEEPGEREEAERRARRLLYVAATRAMRGLMVISSGGAEGPLSALSPERWNIVEAGA